MKQSSLFSFVSNGGLAPSTDVVDLFCGIGGFSCGTTMGGHRVVLAVDNNKDLLNCHKKNHPECRKRIIAGSPFLIANLRFFRSSRKRKLCIRDAIPDPPREFVRNALYKRLDPQTGENVDVPLRNKLRSVDKPSFTILATGHIKWADKDANVLRLLTARERSLLQSFPSDYVLPRRSADALVGVGNAVPPRLAQILMYPTRSS